MSTLHQDLKAIREKQRLTVHDVYEKTRIIEENIRLIESGEIFTREDVNKIYLRSFIRTYGRAVGISEEDIVTALDYMEADMYEGFLAQKYLGIDLRATSGSHGDAPADEPDKSAGIAPPSPPFRVAHDPKPADDSAGKTDSPGSPKEAKPLKKTGIRINEYGEISNDDDHGEEKEDESGTGKRDISARVTESPTTSGSSPSSRPGADSPSAPGSAPSSKPGAAPSSKPGADSPSAPGSTKPSTPGATPSSTPGTVPPSTPGTAPASAPSSTSTPAYTSTTAGSGDSSVNWADVSRKASPGQSGNGLLILLAMVAVVLIGLLIFFLSTSGDDADADTAALRTPGSELALPSDTAMAPVAPDPALLAAALPDTLVLTIYAARGNLEPVRIVSDVFGNIQRPYWVEAGKGMQFEFVQEMQVRGALDRMIILYGDRVITDFASIDEQNRVLRISREQFLRDPTLESFTTGTMPDNLPGPREIMQRPRF